MKRNYLIICETILAECRSIIPDDMIVLSQPFTLHNKPENLNVHLQQVIDTIPGSDCNIFLGYGLCSNATVGLVSPHHRLILLKIHDCIAIFCGSQECLESHKNDVLGTLFLTKRFIESEDGTYHLMEHDKYVERYGEELAGKYTRMVLSGYERAALVETGEYDISQYRETAKKFCEVYELEYTEIPGTRKLLSKLFSGNRDHDIIVKEAGKEVALTDYIKDAL